MEVGAELIGMVKTNTKGLCKDTIEKLTKYCNEGSYLVLRSKLIVPGGRPLIDFGYKYNVRKVLYFIVTENKGIKQIGLPYLSKYPEKFNNFVITPLDLPIVMYIYIFCS